MKPGSTEGRDSAYLVPAVVKALRILEILKNEGTALSITEISRASGCHPSSVHKLLVTLDHFGMVERGEASKKYSLGIVLAEYGRAALNRVDIGRAARPSLEALVERTGETAVLGVLQGTQVVVVDKAEPLVEIRVSPFVGLRFPATATAHGKATLAWLPADKVERIIEVEGLPARTAGAIVDPAAYRAELAEIRVRGYATDCEEFQEGISGAAAPVFDSAGSVLATLSVVGPSFRMSPRRIEECAKECVEEAARLSRRVG